MSTIEKPTQETVSALPVTWPPGARFGAVTLGASFALSVVVGLMTPGYDPAREAISALAATDSEHAWLMIAGFLLAAAGLMATGVTLWQRLSRAATGRVAGRVGAGLVTLSGAMMVVSGLARQDCSERLPSCIDHGEAPLATTHFWVHQYNSLALFLFMTVAMFLLARGVRDSAWRHLSVPLRLAGLWCVLTIVQLMVDPPALDPYQGIVQRVFIVVLFATPVVLAAARGRSGSSSTAAEGVSAHAG